MSQTNHSRRKLLVTVLAGGTAMAAGVAGFVLYKDQTWVDSPAYARTTTDPATTAVIAYSRSGNTLVAAKEAARVHQADLYRIEAPRYPQSISGQMTASSDASNKIRDTEISHQPVDLTRYQSIILASPVWWFRPAVPMWAFVNSHDFNQARVYLLMTGNSRFKQPEIDEFAELVRSRNGVFSDSRFIKRGRVLWQLSTEELRTEAGKLVQDFVT